MHTNKTLHFKPYLCLMSLEIHTKKVEDCFIEIRQLIKECNFGPHDKARKIKMAIVRKCAKNHELKFSVIKRIYAGGGDN